MASLPVRECGLKCRNLFCLCKMPMVTPRAGVWIEMIYMIEMICSTNVTPRAGVWIEIG